MPWAEYALMRYRQQVPEEPDVAAAGGGPRRGLKRQRLQEPTEQKQPQQNGVTEAEEEEQPQRSGCTIM
jgi:hypothetical protein